MAKIKCKPDANPAQIFQVVRAVAEQRGYLWEQDGPETAVASEGGKEIKNKATAMKLRLRLVLDGDKLKLKQETNGAVYAGAAGVPFFTARLAGEAGKFRKLAKRALGDAGLA